MTCPSCAADTDASSRSCGACGEALPVSPGWLIADRYEIQAHLGEGGMGAVFRARDRALHVTVAFKVLRLKADPTAVRRFHHEVTLARKVRHENVCAVYEYGEDQGVLYYTMELVGGRNLRQVLREKGPLPVDVAYNVVLKAAAGLKAIHEAGVLHRDLKTSNIMIDTKDRVRLVDFGIAKAIPTTDEGEPSTDTPITNADAIVGTPAYMSPEQVMGWPLDTRSDIYSFGIVVFELFTGRLPFQGTSRAAVLRKHLEEPPPLHGLTAQSLPTPLVPVLERALAKDPDRRHRDVAGLVRDLERARDALQTDALEAESPPLPLRYALPAAAVVIAAAIYALTDARREQARAIANTVAPTTTSAAVALPSPSLLPSTLPPRTIPPSSARRSASARASPAASSTPTFDTATTTTTLPIPTTTMAAPPMTMAALKQVTASTHSPKPVETPPQCLSCPPPHYPPAAERYGLEGTVVIEIAVDEQGTVTSTRVLSGDTAFRAAAQKAVRTWRFVPAKRDGVPFASTLTRAVEFRHEPRP